MCQCDRPGTSGERAGRNRDEALKLVYTLTDGSKKEITYYEEDQNFYTVIYEDGTKAAHTNKLYVKTMTEKLDRLLEELK